MSMSQAEGDTQGSDALGRSPQVAAESGAHPRDAELVRDGTPGLDRFTYDDSIVRMFAWATAIWAVVATLAGLVIAIQLVLPPAIDRFPAMLG